MSPRAHGTDPWCPIAATLEVVGDAWSLLVLRNTMHGPCRFDELQTGLGIASNVLTTRLKRLTEAGILEKRTYCERPVRCDYVLTERGRDLYPVLESLGDWGRKHLAACPEPDEPARDERSVPIGS